MKESMKKILKKKYMKDILIISALVIVYSIISFINLGEPRNPQSFCAFLDYDKIDFEMENELEIATIRYFMGDIEGSLKVYGSLDGSDYQYIGDIKGYALSWNDLTVNRKCKFIRIQVGDSKASNLGEIQLYDKFKNKVKVAGNNEEANKVLDESNTVPETISYKNSTYFDEIYFATSVYEFTNGYLATEWTHPHLGKIIQSIPAWIMGTTPFSYRLMGNIAGIIMIIIMYLFGKELFKKRRYAFLAAFLMAFDNFHFVQTRIGTVDSFLILFGMISAFFMLKYIKLDRSSHIKKKIIYLFLCGLFFGFSISVKWIGFYTGLGLAILFFGKMIYETIKSKKIEKQNIIIIILCIAFFVIIPLIIYFVCYYIFQTVYGEVKDVPSLIKQTKDMFEFHSTLTETHPFSSPWYTWPIMLKPIWYYTSNNTGTLSSTITAIGNPAIWWFGIIALIFVFVKALAKRKKEDIFIIVMFCAVWLPFALVKRDMFLYHYFTALPFVILSIAKFIEYISEKTQKKWIIWGYACIVLILFCMFYPVVSGMLVNSTYIENMRWLNTWIF